MRRTLTSPRSGAALRFFAHAACVASGLLAGCSSSEPRAEKPRAPEAEASEPARGKALIHVIRGDEGADRMDVKLTADLLGTVTSREFVAAEVEPGNYVLGCFLTYIDRDPVHTFSTVRLAAGRSQYFLVKKVTRPPRPGAFAEEIAILIEELDQVEGERLLPSLRRVTLAKEAPASIPFHEEVAVADDPPSPEVPQPEVVAPAESPDVGADETGMLAEAEPDAPQATLDVGTEAESASEPDIAAVPPPEPEAEVVAGPVSGLEPDESRETDVAEAESQATDVEPEIRAPIEPEDVSDEPPIVARPSVKPVKLYKGPRLARTRIAHLLMGDRVFVAAINGVPHDVGPFVSDLAGIQLPRDAFRTGGVELKPGRYRLEIAWHGPPITRKRTYFGTHEFDVELEAGATYTISGVKDSENVLGWKPEVAKAPRDPSN